MSPIEDFSAVKFDRNDNVSKTQYNSSIFQRILNRQSNLIPRCAIKAPIAERGLREKRGSSNPQRLISCPTQYQSFHVMELRTHRNRPRKKFDEFHCSIMRETYASETSVRCHGFNFIIIRGPSAEQSEQGCGALGDSSEKDLER